MRDIYYESAILRVGPEAKDLIAGGVLILYADPIPDALEEVSVVHHGEAAPSRDIRAGDTLWLGEQRVDLLRIGERASQNLRELGHLVVYLAPSSDQLLPGAVRGEGTLLPPTPGARLVLASGESGR